MRRWNAWGDDQHPAELKPAAQRMLRTVVGGSEPPLDVEIDDVLATVPDSRLTQHELISTDPEQRVRHAAGHSYSDWLALKYGKIERYPDGVAWPENGAQVRQLLDWAVANDVRVIPYGGGTSVVGHLTVPTGDQAVLSLDMSRMNKLLALDEESRIATIEAGASGPQLEQQLAERGYTLGHFPQSFEYSTVGGWVVTRSSGQQSLRYGRIEAMFAGGTLETPAGQWQVPAIPATGAGTDVREMLLGSEGRLGVMTEVLMRVTPKADHESFHAVFFPSWEQGRRAVQALAQNKVGLSMLRLSNARETASHLALAGTPAITSVLERYLALRGSSDNKCLMMFGLTGRKSDCDYARREALKICKRESGVYTGTVIGKAWQKNRFHSAYFRNALWDAGYGVDTAETCVNWGRVDQTMADLEQAIAEVFEQDKQQVQVFTHLSHIYPQGCSVYTTYIFKAGLSYEDDLQRWKRAKQALCQAIVKNGGTISHQHGVGLDHAKYLSAEKNELGLEAMQALFDRFDPKGLMNPGKLVP